MHLVARWYRVNPDVVEYEWSLEDYLDRYETMTIVMDQQQPIPEDNSDA